MRNIRVFYMKNLDYITSDGADILKIHSRQRDFTTNYFELFKGYNQTEEDLKKFYTDLKQWASELQMHRIGYLNYYKHADAVRYVFELLTRNETFQHMPNIPEIKGVEYNYFESTVNGGLMSVGKEYIDVETSCNAYDFPSWYPHLLGSDIYDLKMPMKEGYEYKIMDFKKQLKFGIYDVKITCDDNNFKKLFMFSKNNRYTHYSVNFCLKHKKKFNIKFEILNTDKEYNCYVYDEKDLIKTSSIFCNWFSTLFKIKKEYPKNKLVKHLLSSIWGILCQYNRTIINTDEEFYELDISDTAFKLLDTYEYFNKEKDAICRTYTVLDVNKPYKYNFRLKPFLTSYSRKMFAEFIISNVDNLDNVVRIHTDSVVLRTEQNFTQEYKPILESKNTGLISWKSINSKNE